MVSRSFWGWAVPAGACVLLGAEAIGGLSRSGLVFLIIAPGMLVFTVFAAVRHAETISSRLGETVGAIILALAVTSIEVALVAAVMFQALPGAETVARDTVFAGVMVVLNGVIGISLLAGSARHRSLSFHLQGTASALGVLGTLAIIAMILPNYTLADPGRGYSMVQLLFVSGASLILYGVFLASQAAGQREYFASAEEIRVHHAPASARGMIAAGFWLAVSLVAIVLIADALTPEVQLAVGWAGLPQQFVGVIIAAVVLMPEGMSALRAARDDRLQTSLNFTLGSAIASTGLTIPAISLLAILMGWPIELGLEPEHIVLLVLTLFISTLTLSTGRTTLVQGAVHLVIFLVFLVVAAVP